MAAVYSRAVGRVYMYEEYADDDARTNIDARACSHCVRRTTCSNVAAVFGQVGATFTASTFLSSDVSSTAAKSSTVLLQRPSFAKLYNDYTPRCLNRVLNPERILSLRKYIANLDLFLPSSGGVGSNALVDYIYFHTNVTVRHNLTNVDQEHHWHGFSCHLASPFVLPLIRDPNQTTLVLVGDIWNSLASQYRRKFTAWNIAKTRYGDMKCQRPLQHHMTLYPADPAAQKLLLYTYIFHSTGPNTVFLQAPYMKETINEALVMLGFDGTLIKVMEGFQVVETRSYYNPDDYPEAAELYKPYRRLTSILNTMPKVWRSSDTPNVLKRYLLCELISDEPEGQSVRHLPECLAFAKHDGEDEGERIII